MLLAALSRLLPRRRWKSFNAVAERWVRTVKEECHDWLLMTGRRHLEAVLRTYACHYNQARPHRALDLGVPDAPENRDQDLPRFGEIVRLDQLGV
jgi:transposase InsO family protein